MNKTIAFIGVGIMGRGLVKNLKKTGAKLQIYARNTSKIQDLQDETTKVFTEIKEAVLGSDYIILCLTEDRIVEDAFAEIVSEPYHAIILDFGTTSPDLTEKMHHESVKRGFRFLDSPMTGSKIAAELYDLNIIAPEIQTVNNNMTRFFIISKETNQINKEEINKASIKFELDDTPGSLATVLNVMTNCKLNLTKIQSMPIIETPFQYSFFVDVVFEKYKHYEKAVKILEIMTNHFKVLGEYKNNK